MLEEFVWRTQRGALLLPAIIALALALSVANGANAQQTSTVYTKLGLDNACKWDVQTAEEEEEAQGNCAWCPGHGDLPVRFCEGDLRQSVQYGPIDPERPIWTSFGEFNHVNDTIEWVLASGNPIAAIQRFFIENANPATGEVEEARRGQVLVISTIAGADKSVSCPAGYVDARANSDANVIARGVATHIVPTFSCGIDEAVFHGKRGPYSGSPVVYIE